MCCPSGASSWEQSHIMTLTEHASPLIKFHQLDGTELSYVDSATYLGILIQNTLSFKEHMGNTANKCDSRLGFLRRNLCRCPQALKQTAYFSLVSQERSEHVQYGTPITGQIKKHCRESTIE